MSPKRATDQVTILTGDRARLKDLLRNRLIECGWTDQVRLNCREIVKAEDGKVNVDQLVQQVTPKARTMIPDTVKKELLQKIKTLLLEQEEH
ncbi:enhancer of yellow 2 transcription factor [Phlebotomus argentipes]|uniref:enhancer of yellow 2 transcription factor n=1 Tax=Phlebotomus argentipes TaxID=94469 RepID=UPI0028935C32|nr:enhancer of yellow 2 transcription factor [Phlebotomus argentipes]